MAKSETADDGGAGGLLTKAEAAERLGLSERAVARHAEAGRLQAIYQPKPGGGSRVLYDGADVERLRETLAQPRARGGGMALERVASSSPAPIADPGAFAELLGQALAGALREALPPVAPSLPRLTLNLAEAAASSGLSKVRLREAIGAGELRAVRIGRGWRVRPADLEAYVDTLWSQAEPKPKKTAQPKRR